jgi:hypothetical protein
LDCGIDTSLATGNGHYYRVHDAVWAASGLAPDGRMLCMNCLEQRLSRPLTRADFTRTPFEIMDAMAAGYTDGVRVSEERFAQWLDEQEVERLGVRQWVCQMALQPFRAVAARPFLRAPGKR